MRFVVETGTDVAALGVGDPSLLEDLRTARGRDYAVARDAAIARGSLWRTELEGDGAYLFHIFVDEPPPEQLAAFLRDPLDVRSFMVTSGRLLVGGEEFFVGARDSAATPTMGREIEIPMGEYSLRAYRVEAPDDHVDRQFARAATHDEQSAWRTGTRARDYVVLGSVGAVIASLMAYFVGTPVFLAPLPLLAPAAGWAWLRTFERKPAYTSALARLRAIERELPSIVLVLTSKGPQ